MTFATLILDISDNYKRTTMNTEAALVFTDDVYIGAVVRCG